MRAIEFRPYQKNTLRGFFTIELNGGLQIRDCTLHESHGKAWFGFPGIPYKDKDERTQYKNVVLVPDRGLLDRMQAEVCKQLSQHLSPKQSTEDGNPF